jgi:hypothetical protein
VGGWGRGGGHVVWLIRQVYIISDEIVYTRSGGWVMIERE